MASAGPTLSPSSQAGVDGAVFMLAWGPTVRAFRQKSKTTTSTSMGGMYRVEKQSIVILQQAPRRLIMLRSE